MIENKILEFNFVHQQAESTAEILGGNKLQRIGSATSIEWMNDGIIELLCDCLISVVKDQIGYLACLLFIFHWEW